jgi:hypothetical protein
MSTTGTRSRWATILAVLLLAATALFVVGATVERQGHAETTSTSSEAEEHSEGEAGEGSNPEVSEEANLEAGESNPTGAESGSEAILGVDTESLPVITIAVLIALLLVAAIWWRPRREVLIVAIVFCLGAAVLDFRELLHQLDEGRNSVAILAAAVALLHLAAAGAGVAALRSQPPEVPAGRATTA